MIQTNNIKHKFMKVSFPFVLFAIFLLCSCDKSIKKTTYDHRTNKSNPTSLGKKGDLGSRSLDNRSTSLPKRGDLNRRLVGSTSPINSKQNDEPQNMAVQPKKWRQDLPGGGYADYVLYADGSLSVKQVQPCMFCHGTKICQACGGAGGIYGRAYGGMYYPCQMCLQSGICKSCKGEGTITTVSRTDASGNTNMINSSGYSAVGGPGGAMVTSPDGKRTAHPSGGGDFSGGSSSRHPDNYDKSNDYVETIEYAPNYTGESNNVWCDKCKGYSPRHSHIRKRVY